MWRVGSCLRRCAAADKDGMLRASTAKLHFNGRDDFLAISIAKENRMLQIHQKPFRTDHACHGYNSTSMIDINV